jgi:hypothetical protein
MTKSGRAIRLTLFTIGCMVFRMIGIEGKSLSIPVEGNRAEARIKGRIKAGQRFTRSFGPDFIFELSPSQHASGAWMGWDVSIRQPKSEINLAGMTPPWHGPNDLIIYGWNFLPGENAPHELRKFTFSPEAGKSITWEMMDPRDKPEGYEQTNALLARIEQFGRGELRITRYELTTVADESQLGLKYMEFEARLSWPASYKPR